MIIVGHTAIGIGIGLVAPNPLVAFLAGVVSHHIADYIPHFDPGSYVDVEVRNKNPIHVWGKRDVFMVVVDLVLTAIMVLVFWQHLPDGRGPTLLAGVIGANFPDLVHNVPYLNVQTRKIGWIRWWQDNIHRKYQTTVPVDSWLLGVATQLVTIGIVAWLVFHR